jgi:hypothetical protein
VPCWPGLAYGLGRRSRDSISDYLNSLDYAM